MTTTQKRILISFFVLESLILNATFCDWLGGEKHRFEVVYWTGRSPSESRLIQSFGLFGIYGRDRQTLALDAVLGICIPIAFMTAALLVGTLKRPTQASSENLSEPS